MAGVKRQYDGSARLARAEDVRARLIDTAREMLLRDGYAAVRIPQLAHAEGVSAESVYKRFGSKAGLVKAVVTQALQGLGFVPAEDRADALAAEDLTSLLRGWAQLAGEVAPRVAPILLLLRSAAHDPELAQLERELDADRLTRMTANARRLAEAGHLPPGLSVGRAGELLWTYSSPQVYDLLVLRSGWTLDHYTDFIADGLAGHLR